MVCFQELVLVACGRLGKSVATLSGCCLNFGCAVVCWLFFFRRDATHACYVADF